MLTGSSTDDVMTPDDNEIDDAVGVQRTDARLGLRCWSHSSFVHSTLRGVTSVAELYGVERGIFDFAKHGRYGAQI